MRPASRNHISTYCAPRQNRQELPVEEDGQLAPLASKVVSMPLSAQRGLQLIREAAANSSKVVNTLVFREDQTWMEVVTSRQLQLCLEEGELLGTPNRDEHGNWVCRLYRLCGGVDVVARVVIRNESDGNHRLYITEVQRKYD